ncbi:MAG: hypothetical protein KC448_06465 [Yoonia sp.]|nr:hypothetical protein [Yoonia sp.]
MLVTQTQEIGSYAQLADWAAGHHAPHVRKTVSLVAKERSARSHFKSVTKDDGPNATAFLSTLSGKKYAFSYDRKRGVIRIRHDSDCGVPIGDFNDRSSQASIEQTIRIL